MNQPVRDYMPVSSRAFRKAMGLFATGVTVVSVPPADGEEPVGITINSFASVSLDPPLVLWCLDRGAEMLSRFAGAASFGVSVLCADQHELSLRFSEGSDRGFANVPHETWTTGAPLISGALARMECGVQARHDGGDHLILVGRVLKLDSRAKGRPLVFFQGRYTGVDG